jgi:hypothetical protein
LKDGWLSHLNQKPLWRRPGYLMASCVPHEPLAHVSPASALTRLPVS